MNFVDTHAHVYMDEYDTDRSEMLERARRAGVSTIIMPNVDVESLDKLNAVRDEFSEQLQLCIGLHPTYVKDDYKVQLSHIEKAFDNINHICAIGEIGIDLYWETQFLTQQEHAFRIQLQWAVDRNLPVAIHVRNAFPEVFAVLNDFPQITGVFHCFSGGEEEARALVKANNFYLGIGGVATFKNAKLLRVLKKEVPLDRLVLETDAPFLSPTPFRGQRNESAYIPIIAQVLADTYEVPLQTVADVTTCNAQQLFGL